MRFEREPGEDAAALEVGVGGGVDRTRRRGARDHSDPPAPSAGTRGTRRCVRRRARPTSATPRTGSGGASTPGTAASSSTQPSARRSSWSTAGTSSRDARRVTMSSTIASSVRDRGIRTCTAVKATAAAVDTVHRPPPGLVVLIYHRVGRRTAVEVDLPLELFADQIAELRAHPQCRDADRRARRASLTRPPPRAHGRDHLRRRHRRLRRPRVAGVGRAPRSRHALRRHRVRRARHELPQRRYAALLDRAARRDRDRARRRRVRTRTPMRCSTGCRQI